MQPGRWVFLFLSVSTLASGGGAPTKKADHVGYVYCASDQSDRLTPVFLDPCIKSRVGNFSCGQKLEVVARSGSWLKVVTSDGITRFINSGAVSQKPDELVPLDIETGPAPECKAIERDPAKNHGPRAVFTREPDYPERPDQAHREGSVELALVVGTDGRPHDVKVVTSLNKDFDKKAIEAVKQWRFDPALKDGQPVEAPIHVSISFRVIH